MVVDTDTRNFLIELSKAISTKNGAIVPPRASKQRFRFEAAHVVKEGDIITLGE
jgi:hypothetical protein